MLEHSAPGSSLRDDNGNALIADEAGVFEVPGEIFSAGDVEGADIGVPKLDTIFGGGALPLAKLHVAVGKRKGSGTGVKGAGEIAPSGGAGSVDVKAVIDGIGMLVDGEPGHRGGRNITNSEELAVGATETPASVRGL